MLGSLHLQALAKPKTIHILGNQCLYKISKPRLWLEIYWGYNKSINLEFDQVKRDKTLLERGLDFARAVEVFDGIHFTGQDKRVDYEEDRFITVGWLDANMIVMVWTPRGEVRRMISMRKANDREKTLYASYVE
jgi:uncharacterized DUF497 family protein